MAAVLCLIMLPLMASLGFMFGVVRGDMSAASVLGGIVFFLLAGFLLFSALNMSRIWDEDETR
jgi:hypothetical protein